MTIKELEDLNYSINNNLIKVKEEIDNNFLIKQKQIIELFNSYKKSEFMSINLDTDSKYFFSLFDSFFELTPIGINIKVSKCYQSLNIILKKSYNNRYLSESSKFYSLSKDIMTLTFSPIDDDYYQVMMYGNRICLDQTKELKLFLNKIKKIITEWN